MLKLFIYKASNVSFKIIRLKRRLKLFPRVLPSVKLGRAKFKYEKDILSLSISKNRYFDKIYKFNSSSSSPVVLFFKKQRFSYDLILRSLHFYFQDSWIHRPRCKDLYNLVPTSLSLHLHFTLSKLSYIIHLGVSFLICPKNGNPLHNDFPFSPNTYTPSLAFDFYKSL